MTSLLLLAGRIILFDFSNVCVADEMLTIPDFEIILAIEEFPIIGFYLYHVTSAGQSSNWTTSGIKQHIYTDC